MKQKFIIAALFAAITTTTVIFSEEIELEDLTVTTSRTEKKKVEVPATLSSVPEEEKKIDNPVYQKDSLNAVPGVLITQTSSTVGHTTGIRMPTGTSPYYLFLEDGVPVQSSGFFNHNGLAYPGFTGGGSMEVLKGPGSALYGSDAVGGTINMLNPVPTQDFSAILGLEGGLDSFGKGSVKISDTLENGNGYAGSLSYTYNKGWREHTKYDRQEGLFRFFLNADKDNTVKFTLSASRTDAEMAGNILSLEELEKNPASKGDIILDSDPYRRFQYLRFVTDWNKKFGSDVTMNNIVYGRYNRNEYMAVWAPSSPENDSIQYAGGLMHKTTFQFSSSELIAGLDSEVTKADDKYVQKLKTTNAKKYPLGEVYNYTVTYTSIAPYLQYTHYILKNFSAEAGLRFDAAHFDYTNKLTDGVFGVYKRPDSKSDYTFTHLSPKAGLNYLITEKTSLFTRYANGFRIPQGTMLYRLTNTDSQQISLSPETSHSIEVGFKHISKPISLELTGYYMEVHDLITRLLNPSNKEYYYKNDGKSKHVGGEAAVSLQFLSHFTIKLAYTYAQSKFLENATYQGKFMASAPEHIGNARLFFEPTFLKGFISELEWQYVSKYWMDDNNTKQYAGYHTGNFKMSYEFLKHFRVFGKITNLLDTHYAESASISYGSERYVPGSPRAFFIGSEFIW